MKCENKECGANQDGECGSTYVTSECVDFIPKPEQTASAPVDSLSAGSVCSWEPEEYGDSKTCLEWGTDCGFLFRFVFIQDLLNFEFCPYCGKILKLEESKQNNHVEHDKKRN